MGKLFKKVNNMEEPEEIPITIENESGQSQYFLALHYNFGGWNTVTIAMSKDDCQKAIGEAISRNNEWERKTNGKNFDDGSKYMIVSFYLPSTPKK